MDRFFDRQGYGTRQLLYIRNKAMRGGILVESKGRLSNIDLCKDLNSIVNSKAIVSYRTALVDTDGNLITCEMFGICYMPQYPPSLSPLGLPVFHCRCPLSASLLLSRGESISYKLPR